MTKFRAYYRGLSAAEKRTLARRLNTSPAYLSQLAYGHRQAGAKILLAIESATLGAVKPADMRPEICEAAA